MYSRDKAAEGSSQPAGFGAGWEKCEEAGFAPNEPFLLKRLVADWNAEQKERFETLLRKCQDRGIHLIEPDRQVGPFAPGTTILHDGNERALCKVAGGDIAEWVRDILVGTVSTDEFLQRVDDILATTPKCKPADDSVRVPHVGLDGIGANEDAQPPINSDMDAAIAAEADRAAAWTKEAFPLRNIPHGTLRLWNGRNEVSKQVLLKGTSVLDMQIELSEYVLSQHPDTCLLSYRFAHTLSLQFCSGWSKGTIYDGGSRRGIRMHDAGPLGRVLWNNRRQFEEGYIKGIEYVRRFAEKQAATWKPGLHDAPILRIHGARYVRGWEPISVDDGEMVERWRDVVKRERPTITCVACENYVKQLDGTPTGSEMFTLTFELAVVQHPITFGWLIGDDCLSQPLISLEDRISLGQLMQDEDYR